MSFIVACGWSSNRTEKKKVKKF